MVYALLIIVLNLQRTLNDGNSIDGCIFCRLQNFSILPFEENTNSLKISYLKPHHIIAIFNHIEFAYFFARCICRK